MKENHAEKKAYEIVLEYFQNKILRGEIQISDKLPAERDIAEQLCVSRNSVREAIRMLEMMGFIECMQGSGNYICCHPRNALTKTFNMMMILRGTNYNEIFDTRLATELEAIELAYHQITAEQLSTMHCILTQLDTACDKIESARLDMEFHRLLIQSSHNTLLIYLSQLMGDLSDIFIQNIHLTIWDDSECAQELRDAHWNIYNSLADKVPGLGHIAIKQHFNIVRRHLTKIESDQKHANIFSTSAHSDNG